MEAWKTDCAFLKRGIFGIWWDESLDGTFSIHDAGEWRVRHEHHLIFIFIGVGDSVRISLCIVTYYSIAWWDGDTLNLYKWATAATVQKLFSCSNVNGFGRKLTCLPHQQPCQWQLPFPFLQDTDLQGPSYFSNIFQGGTAFKNKGVQPLLLLGFKCHRPPELFLLNESEWSSQMEVWLL